MKETQFIKQNIGKWKEYEGELNSQSLDPKKISRLFVQVTDDLAYSQTFYKNRSVRLYLNGIAQLLFNQMNRGSRFQFKTIVNFWRHELPLNVYRARRELTISLVFFLISIGIGVLSSIHVPDFAHTILSEEYVEMTKRNIENNDPMAVYKDTDKLGMFLRITKNNIKVSFAAFVLGLFAGLGTLYVLLRNGIMLGTFQYFFIERDLFWESFLTVWQHGAMEISAIVIAGGAGLTLGRGLILPGTYTRSQSLRLAARRGLKILLGLVPVFIMAGFIEGYFTRNTEAPDSIRLISILLSAGFVLIYFVLYPIYVARRNPEKAKLVDKIEFSSSKELDFEKIQGNESLFSNSLKLLSRSIGKLFKLTLFIGLVMGGLIAFFPDELIGLSDAIAFEVGGFRYFLSYWGNGSLFIANTFILALVLGFLAYAVHQIELGAGLNLRTFFVAFKNWIVNALLASSFINVLFFLPLGWAVFLMIATLPFIVLAYYCSYKEKSIFFAGIQRGFYLLKGSFGKLFVMYLVFGILATMVIILLNPDFYWTFLAALEWNLFVEDEYLPMIFNGLISVVFYTGALISLASIAIAINYLYYTLFESSTASHLLARIEGFGQKKTVRGYEME